MTKKKTAVIFDMDGTLADTIESIRSAVNKTMDHFGFPRQDYNAVRMALGSGVRVLLTRLIPAEASADDEKMDEIISYYAECYAETHTEADHCYPGVGEAVRTLAAAGVKLAILSNKPDQFVRNIAAILFPEGIIELAMGQTEDMPTKPDPKAPLYIAGQLGVEPGDCYFVGDSEVDVMTAKNAGMTSVGCSWGYRGREVLEQAGADFVVDNAEQLLQSIKY